MTAALHDEVVTLASALRLVPDTPPVATPAPRKRIRRTDLQPFGSGGDPLVEGAARLLSVPVRHVYAALWRVGFIDIQA